jgi:hypothetical protein
MANHRPPLRVLCFTVLMVLIAASRAHATLITITSASFSGSESVADFTVATTQLLPYSEDGATFVSYSGPLSSVLSFNNFLFMAGSGTLRVDFSVPQIRAGFFFGAPIGSGITISAQAFSDLAGTQSLGTIGLGSFAANQTGFVGFEADALLSRADISFAVSSASASFRIDDFRFEPGATPVPEPETLLLTLVGGGWLAARHARRQRR